MKKTLVLLAAASLITGTAYAEEKYSEGVVAGDGAKLFYAAENFHDMAVLPGFTMLAPSGLVPSYGVIFGGISGKTNSDNTDGSLAIGMGFGDAEKIGGSATLGIGSVDPRDGGAFNRGSLNLNAGHHFKNWGAGVAVGVSGIDLWHADSDGDLDPSFYGAVTKLLPNEVAPVVLTAGLGNNGYVDIKKKGDPKDEIGVFASAAVYLMPQVSLIADYTTGIVTIGTGIVPFPEYPVSLTLGITDITEQADDKPSFIGSLSAAYVF